MPTSNSFSLPPHLKLSGSVNTVKKIPGVTDPFEHSRLKKSHFFLAIWQRAFTSRSGDLNSPYLPTRSVLSSVLFLSWFRR